MAEYASHLESRVGESPANLRKRAEQKQPGIPWLSISFERIGEIALSEKQLHEARTGIDRVLEAPGALSHLQSASHRFESIERDLAIIDDLLVTGSRFFFRADARMGTGGKETEVYRRNCQKYSYEKSRQLYPDKIAAISISANSASFICDAPVHRLPETP
jgi:hypothetical protein